MEITTLTRLDARYPILILPFCEFCFSFPFHFSVKNYSSFETLYSGADICRICLELCSFGLKASYLVKMLPFLH